MQAPPFSTAYGATPPPGDDRPAWAVGLPSTASLTYVRTSAGALLVLLVAAWVVWSLISNPARVQRAFNHLVGGGH